MTSEILTIEITPQMGIYLDQLVRIGIMGSARSEVAGFLLQQAIWQMLDKGQLQKIEIDDRPKCLHCGSPNIGILPVMGSEEEIQCADCGKIFDMPQV